MKYVTTLLLVAILGINANAQKTKQNSKKIEALRIAYITEELDLSVEEAQQFWPIFNTYESTKKELNKRKRETIQQSIVENTLDELLIIEEDNYNALRSYIDELRDILSDEKIINLMSIEKRFKERLIKRLNNKP